MTDREVMQQALEALESTGTINQIGGFTQYFDGAIVDKAISAIEAALAQPEQEPTCPECKAAVLYECVACSSNNYPPKPEQEPLTGGEIYTAYITAANQTLRPQDERIAFAFARAIEAAHNIKEGT
jgi:hypothetical protein